MRVSLWSLSMLACALLAGAAPVPAAGQDKGKEKDPTARDLDAYRLRVGDVVTITVYNGNRLAPELTAQNVAVPGNGDVSLPPIGKIHLLDRTAFDVQESVAQKFKDDGYLA